MLLKQCQRLSDNHPFSFFIILYFHLCYQSASVHFIEVYIRTKKTIRRSFLLLLAVAAEGCAFGLAAFVGENTVVTPYADAIGATMIVRMKNAGMDIA